MTIYNNNNNKKKKKKKKKKKSAGYLFYSKIKNAYQKIETATKQNIISKTYDSSAVLHTALLVLRMWHF